MDEEARRVFTAYGFDEIRTPVIEQTALFERSVGADTDIVSKEMFTFRDRDEESVSLRPEATASVIRACIENGLFNQGRVHKLYYSGPMFRRERPQKGRYRQFYQIGAEVLGADEPEIDAEILEMLLLFLDRIGIRDFSLVINSVGCENCRPEYVKELRKALGAIREKLCGDCQRRAEANPLRVLDCKVEADQPLIAGLPRIVEHLCVECRQHFEGVRAGLEARGITHQVTPRLVRGLDYYTRTTFEVTSPALGAQNALLGGGRYDGLAEMLGGPRMPGLGFAIGQDRLMLAVEHSGFLKVQPSVDAYVAWMGDRAMRPAAELSRSLRREGLSVEIHYAPMKLKKSLGIANRLHARFAIIIGEGELESGRYQVKDMGAGTQEEVEPARLSAYLAEKLQGSQRDHRG